ncbi:uroporphyrinogen decarboxylase/cobalamine-independent methonine synthase family protein [Candidatus Contubernalis alkaliaceticus]|uniref:hypothetical protein n=1 Tax=Candidatus Contubernalis alkaliaceticus TaxID=338645 RepID=UPI001F4BF283|nr:hypothetical protein [Candidatus Contubernalis alkalaceticus]UNC92364.1 hypothetical protein HUE98_09785 [Candidatus Contubernalis alkalaceticus]
MNKPYRMATGIGSLPFTDENQALSLIFKNMPFVPHWPQLPKLSKTEGIIEQFLFPLIETGILRYNQKGNPFFDTGNPAFTDSAANFYNFYLAAGENDPQAQKMFTMHPKYASGYYAFIKRLKQQGVGEAKFIKGQVSGPLTVGIKLTDADLEPSFYKDELRDIMVRALEMQMIQQVKEMHQFKLPVIIFIDDPGLCYFGQAPYIGLNRNHIIESYSVMIESIHKLGALVGVHVCSGIDWSILVEAGVDIINLDAVNYSDSLLVYTESLQEFMNQGGIIAWGIVATLNRSISDDAKTVINRLEKCLNTLVNKGFSQGLLNKQLMITPSCGTGTLSSELAEKVYTLTGEVQNLL